MLPPPLLLAVLLLLLSAVAVRGSTCGYSACTYSWYFGDSSSGSSGSGTVGLSEPTCDVPQQGTPAQYNGQSLSQCGWQLSSLTGNVTLRGTQYSGTWPEGNPETGDAYVCNIQCNTDTGYPWPTGGAGWHFYYQHSTNQPGVLQWDSISLQLQQNYEHQGSSQLAPWSSTFNAYSDTVSNQRGNFTLCCPNFLTPDGCYGPNTQPQPNITISPQHYNYPQCCGQSSSSSSSSPFVTSSSHRPSSSAAHSSTLVPSSSPHVTSSSSKAVAKSSSSDSKKFVTSSVKSSSSSEAFHTSSSKKSKQHVGHSSSSAASSCACTTGRALFSLTYSCTSGAVSFTPLFSSLTAASAISILPNSMNDTLAFSTAAGTFEISYLIGEQLPADVQTAKPTVVLSGVDALSGAAPLVDAIVSSVTAANPAGDTFNSGRGLLVLREQSSSASATLLQILLTSTSSTSVTGILEIVQLS